MATLIRSRKSASSWDDNELHAYNVTIVEESKNAFFGHDDLPLPTSPGLAGFLAVQNRADAQDSETRKLLHCLDLAHAEFDGKEPAVDKLITELLLLLGYASGDRIIFLRRPQKLVICSHGASAEMNFCVLNDDDSVVLAGESKKIDNPDDKEPQMIAELIAARARNNEIRGTPQGQEVLPAIIMHGSSPTFYKASITSALCDCVREGTYPAVQTVVQKFSPVLPVPMQKPGTGMGSIENRLEIMRCLEAFRAFLPPEPANLPNPLN